MSNALDFSILAVNAAPANESRWSPRSLVADWIGIDPRALAAFRIGMAAILLVDLAIRASDLTNFYSEGGFFPFEAATRWHGSRWNWSLHLIDGSPAFQSLLLLLAAVLAVAMLLGYRTTLAVIGSWVLLASIHNRVPMLLNGGDIIFRMLLFWGMFLPLGRVWSLDARRRRLRSGNTVAERRQYQPAVSLATVAVMMQLCLMYWFTGQFKYNSEWLGGDSMYYVFSFDAYGRPLGRFLLGFPWICKAMTWGTLWLELIGPWLVMLPSLWLVRLADSFTAYELAPRWARTALRDLGRYLRPLVVLAFVGLHVGIELTMTVGLFSYVSIVGWMVFVPPWIWDAATRRVSALTRTSTAVVFETPPPASFSTWLRPLRILGGGLHGCVCLLLLGYVVWWNVASLQKRGDFDKVMPKPMEKPAGLLMVGQKWSMFSRPTKDDGWFVAQARTSDGREIDILRDGAAVDLSKPADVAGIFPNHRWRKFYRQLIPDSAKRYRASVARHLGNMWNDQHDPQQHIVDVELLYFRERTLLDPAKISVVRVELIRVELEPSTSDGAAELASRPQPETPR
ncbi:MAG: HTTM domain-containing protein [Pirellulaceae bacterium]